MLAPVVIEKLPLQGLAAAAAVAYDLSASLALSEEALELYAAALAPLMFGLMAAGFEPLIATLKSIERLEVNVEA